MRKSIINIFVLAIIITISSCDDRYDALKNLNDAPSLTIEKQVNGQRADKLTDTVKLSKAQYSYSPIILTAHDPNENIKSVTYSIEQGSGYVIFKDATIPTDEILPFPNTRTTLKVVPTNMGTTVFHFIVTDRFDLKDSTTLTLISFQNLPPVASLYTSKLAVVDKYEYSLDASESYDQDKNYGGIIKKYVFQVNDETIETIQPAIKYIFPATGNYVVTLKVMDNDNQFSKQITQTVTVQ